MGPESCRYSLKAAFEKAAYQRGLSSEKITENALSKLAESVEWIKAFRHATRFEDKKKGIDFVIQTDIGNLFLQVKSSPTGREKFLEKHPKIPVIVVNRDLNLKDTQETIMLTLSEQRNIYLNKRLGYKEAS